MAGVKGKSGRKPNLANTNAKNKDRAERAERAQANNTGFQKIGAPPRGTSDYQKKLWRKVVDSLAEKNLLTNLDEEALLEYVSWVEISHMSDKEIREHGILIQDIESGKLMKNPAIDVKNNATRNLKSIGSSLGLDPVARAALLSEQPTDDESEMENLMQLFGGGKKSG